ncbi:hypothetical protein KIW84_044106 [Lathyrus oleraceus]|uniref:Uncharacterized protein n=1 Tax=Pisum sativum TaxID=3888 RepID=A0A9D4XFR5_PEA|nr:hypothetical protein KIW84_044106 [Pisum sativum]
MDHLEQENRELKEEVAKLSALMESFLAAQNQSSPPPATPPQRTVISEIVSSTVPAASALFVPTAMPTLSSFYYERMIASAPSDFTEMDP